MSTLPQAQRQLLKTKAHQLKPVVMMGNNGLTEAVHLEITRALFDHELIKVRLPGADKEAQKAMMDDVCITHQATLIQKIGHIAVFYKKREEKK